MLNKILWKVGKVFVIWAVKFAHKKLDKNKDGVVDLEEFLAVRDELTKLGTKLRKKYY